MEAIRIPEGLPLARNRSDGLGLGRENHAVLGEGTLVVPDLCSELVLSVLEFIYMYISGFEGGGGGQ